MKPYELAKELIQTYCDKLELPTSALFKSYGRGRCKVYKSVHVDFVRMALSLYIYEKFPFHTDEVAKLVGYKCRSTISNNRPTTLNYIEMEDRYFMPYWSLVEEIGNLYDPKIDFIRTDNGYVRQKHY